MSEEAEKLLMMFICDSYKNSSGRASKKTAIALMKYVAGDKALSVLVNSGNHKAVLSYRSDKELAKEA